MLRIIGKFFKWLAITILSVILIIVIYNVFDNNRIKVVEQEVKVVDLPEEFEGFKILQIADLHGKTFGKNQKRLLKKMNAIDYDMIAICGDMMDKHTEDTKPFFDILDGLENKENIVYVKGDTGLEAINESTGEITSDGELLMEMGLVLLMLMLILLGIKQQRNFKTITILLTSLQACLLMVVIHRQSMVIL